MPIQSLNKLYVDELKDLYSAENQLLKALPKMAKAASSDELRTGFEKHLEQTKGHVERLEQIFESLDESPKGKKCAGMEGLVKEGSEVMEEDFEDAVLDSALIGAARRVEHYEMAAYSTACEIAKDWDSQSTRRCSKRLWQKKSKLTKNWPTSRERLTSKPAKKVRKNRGTCPSRVGKRLPALPSQRRYSDPSPKDKNELVRRINVCTTT
jgi:ferritin-like metal-binding protein YciE